MDNNEFNEFAELSDKEQSEQIQIQEKDNLQASVEKSKQSQIDSELNPKQSEMNIQLSGNQQKPQTPEMNIHRPFLGNQNQTTNKLEQDSNTPKTNIQGKNTEAQQNDQAQNFEKFSDDINKEKLDQLDGRLNKPNIHQNQDKQQEQNLNPKTDETQFNIHKSIPENMQLELKSSSFNQTNLEDQNKKKEQEQLSTININHQPNFEHENKDKDEKPTTNIDQQEDHNQIKVQNHELSPPIHSTQILQNQNNEVVQLEQKELQSNDHYGSFQEKVAQPNAEYKQKNISPSNEIYQKEVNIKNEPQNIKEDDKKEDEQEIKKIEKQKSRPKEKKKKLKEFEEPTQKKMEQEINNNDPKNIEVNNNSTEQMKQKQQEIDSNSKPENEQTQQKKQKKVKKNKQTEEQSEKKDKIILEEKQNKQESFNQKQEEYENEKQQNQKNDQKESFKSEEYQNQENELKMRNKKETKQFSNNSNQQPNTTSNITKKNQNNDQEQINNEKKKNNVITYINNGIEYEAEVTEPRKEKTEKIIDFFSEASGRIQKQNTSSFAKFKQSLQLKQKQKSPEKNQIYPSVVTTIKPKKDRIVQPIQQQPIKQKQKLQKVQLSSDEKRVSMIRSLQPPTIIKKQLKQDDSREKQKSLSPQQATPQTKKDQRIQQLQKQLEMIKYELQVLEKTKDEDQNHENLASSKLPSINDHSTHHQIEEPLIRKYNQVIVMTQISDDKEKRQQAIELVKKLERERSEREKKFKKDFDKVNEMIHSQLTKITKEQVIMNDHVSKERQLKIMERITQQDQRKYEMAMKQQASLQFVKELQYKGPDGGQVSKKYLQQLKQEIKIDQFDENEQQQEKDQLNEKKIKMGSIFTKRIIEMDKQRVKKEKFQKYQKKELYEKRKAYGRHVIENFIPSIQQRYQYSNPERLLTKNYRIDDNQYYLEIDQQNKGDIQSIKEEVDQQVQFDEMTAKQKAKKRAWQIHNEMFNIKPVPQEPFQRKIVKSLNNEENYNEIENEYDEYKQ